MGAGTRALVELGACVGATGKRTRAPGHGWRGCAHERRGSCGATNSARTRGLGAGGQLLDGARVEPIRAPAPSSSHTSLASNSTGEGAHPDKFGALLEGLDVPRSLACPSRCPDGLYPISPATLDRRLESGVAAPRPPDFEDGFLLCLGGGDELQEHEYSTGRALHRVPSPCLRPP